MSHRLPITGTLRARVDFFGHDAPVLTPTMSRRYIRLQKMSAKFVSCTQISIIWFRVAPTHCSDLWIVRKTCHFASFRLAQVDGFGPGHGCHVPAASASQIPGAHQAALRESDADDCWNH